MGWQEEMVERLERAKPSERKKIFEEYMDLTGYSQKQLYRIASLHGYSSGRKPRRDRGRLRSGLTDDQIDFIAGLIYTTGRELKGPIMPVEVALEIAQDNGIIEPGQISVGRLQQILRERQMNRKAFTRPEPYTPLRSLHPNHCHVFDVSVCIQYYLKGNKGLKIMDERDFYKNKPQNFAKVKTRLLRYVIVDHFSGAFYFQYFNTTGETQKNLYEFLINAWSKKNDEKYPFRGVPYVLLLDTGAANASRAIVEFLRRLEIEIPEGMPHNPRRQGAVEIVHNLIEMHFESKLRLQPAHTIEDLNRWAYDFCVSFNARKIHTRHGLTRTQCWLYIKEDQLRELPAKEILNDLFSEPEVTRVVGKGYTIRFRGEEYNLKHIEGIHPNAIVRVRLKPYVWPTVDVIFGDTVYEVAPIERLPRELGGFRRDSAVIGQEYRAQPETPTQKAKKRLDNLAYGEDRGKTTVPFAGLKVFDHQRQKIQHAYIERRGTPIEVDRSVTDREIPITEFFKRLIREVGPISKELNQRLKARYGSSIKVQEAEALLSQIQTGRWVNGKASKSQ